MKTILKCLMAFSFLLILPLPAHAGADPAPASASSATAAAPAKPGPDLNAMFGDFAGRVVSVNEETDHFSDTPGATIASLASNDPVISQMRDIADRNGLTIRLILEGGAPPDPAVPNSVNVTVHKVAGAWRVAPGFTLN